MCVLCALQVHALLCEHGADDAGDVLGAEVSQALGAEQGQHVVAEPLGIGLSRANAAALQPLARELGQSGVGSNGLRQIGSRLGRGSVTVALSGGHAAAISVNEGVAKSCPAAAAEISAK
jgi:hypothetical protein